MKKDFMRRVLGATLALAIAVPGVHVFADPIDLDVEYKEAELKVLVPTETNVGKIFINPSQSDDASADGTESSQITSNLWNIANMTLAEVMVGVELTAAAGEDVVQKYVKTEVNDHDDNGVETITEKQIYVELAAATALTATPDGTNPEDIDKMVFTDQKFPNATAKVAVAGPAGHAKNVARIEFFLERGTDSTGAATVGDKVATGTAGVASARVKGLVNGMAPDKYTAADLEGASVLFDVRAIKKTYYDKAKTTGFDTLNVKAVRSYNPAFVADPALTAKMSADGKTATINVYLGSGASLQDSFFSNYISFKAPDIAAFNIVADPTNATVTGNVITLTESTINAFKGKEVEITVTFAKGSVNTEKTVTLKIPA